MKNREYKRETILLFDCRNVTATLRFNALCNSYFTDFSRILVLAPETVSITDFDCMLEKLKLITLPMKVDDASCLKYGVRNIEKFISSNIRELNGNITLLTSFPRGLLFSIYTKLSLRSGHKAYFQLIDDGYSNIRPENYEVKTGVWNFLKRCYVLVRFGVTSWENHGFFNLKHFSRIFTVYPEVISQFTKAEVYNVSSIFRSYMESQALNFRIPKGSTLFLSHHAIESMRLTKAEYYSLVSELLKGISDRETVFLSMHHSESSHNSVFYDSLGIQTEYSSFPAELFIAGGMISRIIAPFNSTLLECDRLQTLGAVEDYTGYIIPDSPMIESRIQDTMDVCERRNIELSLVDFRKNK